MTIQKFKRPKFCECCKKPITNELPYQKHCKDCSRYIAKRENRLRSKYWQMINKMKE